jgi:hypothetical protein
MQDHEAGQKLLQRLSSTCEELSTSNSRRDQELQSLSELLQSIKQLQDQADEVSEASALALAKHPATIAAVAICCIDDLT